MIRTILTVAVAAGLSMATSAVLAQAAKTPPTPPPGAATCPVATTGHLQRMQAMHEAMMKAGTPQERARLREQQWTLMHQGMGLMSSMRGGGMGMGEGKPGSGMAMGPGRPGMGMGMAASRMGMGGACTAERMAMMEMMMQMMMDRMDHESPPAK